MGTECQKIGNISWELEQQVIPTHL